MIAFLELLFSCGQHEMEISFSRISEACLVSNEDVELLVMKAQSLELIRGSIDQVSESVRVDWVLPRYLSTEHLKLLASRIGDWQQKMEEVIRQVEDGSGELLVKYE